MVSFRRYMRIPNELKPSVIFKQDSLSPSKIALQIALLQLFYYTTASVLFFCWAKLSGQHIEMKNWLFTSKYIEFTNGYGLTLSLLWLLDSLICVIFLTVIVGRSKLAWDFAITIHAINLIVVWIYSGNLPSFPWFILQIFSSLILIFLGTYTTRWRELRDTFFEGMVDTLSTDDLNRDQINNINSSENIINNKPIEMRDIEAQQ
ncbi:similar to Saccharomyces cerevisiae YJL004C SYS1 Integral membrane protein of the Golgi required for targeting of the Arf-like GTPase Arl3p to the Golgi [Maudiozyma saulgeensis]|uniref:Similar to Saccharomyces cerevisiae YJL004C SYS1 Integral membrane protein of the Golgi required for targeting of the Arf-like GTPase Arl3p to the Golgi n=1 Tax=Maudiozyma saulgeensis TaxID=1789683 RepID=A0A1X7QYW4_9SACH|nr:similar to Saccharomyces cerevisiae YJL004C SYS1 Integral membrane protein of the Golgi required for targeting of the Arf-like GTPase Arl3p to the Golgi [Kazachstania saulgeensis]